jgi:hypothetical protein
MIYSNDNKIEQATKNYEVGQLLKRFNDFLLQRPNFFIEIRLDYPNSTKNSGFSLQ